MYYKIKFILHALFFFAREISRPFLTDIFRIHTLKKGFNRLFLTILQDP